MGKQFFESRRCWSSVTRQCKYGSATRNKFLYRIYDTPGVNSPEELATSVDVETDIRRCLYCTSPGFHAIVLVLSAAERITKEDMTMLKKLDGLLGESAYKYMILMITKLEDNETVLNEMMAEAPQIVELNVKCRSRRVIFGNDATKIPDACVQKFDEMLTNLIKENAKQGSEYYRHKYYDEATKILEKDKSDYLKDHPDTSESVAFEIVRNRATEGLSPRDRELRSLNDPNCCTIS